MTNSSYILDEWAFSSVDDANDEFSMPFAL